MERLTYVKCPHRWDSGKHPTKYTSRYTFQEVVARLAAYEDTRLDPDEIELMKEAQEIGDNMTPHRLGEILKAERDGRLVVLPPVEIYNERLWEAGYLLNVLQRGLHMDGLDTKAADRVAEIAHEEAEAALERREEPT